MFKGVIEEKGFKRLLLIFFSLFFFFSLISGLVLYNASHVPLGPHYGATHTIVTQARESLIIKAIVTNLIFFLLAAVGVTFLGILYSHRIAGPLFKVKQYAAALGEGRFDARVRFRKNDAIHTLSSVLNEMAEACQDRSNRIAKELGRLEEGLLLLDSLPGSSKDKSALIKRLGEVDTRIREENQKLKL